MFTDDNQTQLSDPQTLLKRMKSEFLVAQQRRRATTPQAASHPHNTDGDPLIVHERADVASATAVGVRKLEPCD